MKDPHIDFERAIPVVQQARDHYDQDDLDQIPPSKLQDPDLVHQLKRYLAGYQEPNSYFSGDNRMAELANEVLRRYESREHEGMVLADPGQSV